jgi:hypothetical protein
MRFLLAGVLAALTAAGLAAIRPAVLTEEEQAAALAIREARMRADVRFLSSDLLEGRGPGTRGDRLARAYIASRFEAIGLEPGVPADSWLLRGRDPDLAREAVVYGSALDNASGLAALLAVAEAFAALPERPRRSILFAAAAAGKHVALAGPAGSSLDEWVRAVAQAQGRTVAPGAFPDGGACCRFDIRPDGDLRGAVEDARLLFHVGVKAADAPLAPAARPGTLKVLVDCG